MHDEERKRRSRRERGGLIAVVLIGVVLSLAAWVPSPYAIERPGPSVDVLGTVTLSEDDGPVYVIEAPELQLYRDEGSLDLLTVSVAGSPEHPRSWLALFPALIDPSQRIVPLAELFPEGTTGEQRDAQNAVLMDGSQVQAAAAAFAQVGEPVGVELSIAGVEEGSPAAGLLAEGDVLVRAGDVPVTDFTALRERIVAAGEGPLAMTVERDGRQEEIVVDLVVPDGGTEPMLGAAIATAYELPAEVDFSLADIGGPSAGLVFALGLVDLLTPEAMLEGLHVAGTGTIDADGAVGAIGGLEQKMWAASRSESDLFLMPLANCALLPESIPGGLTVAPVATLQEAITAVETTSSGGQPAGLERCGEV